MKKGDRVIINYLVGYTLSDCGTYWYRQFDDESFSKVNRSAIIIDTNNISSIGNNPYVSLYRLISLDMHTQLGWFNNGIELDTNYYRDLKLKELDV